jgi:hypothetical protein
MATITFTVASVLTILVALLHASGLASELPDASWKLAEQAMRDAGLERGFFRFNLYGVFESVWLEVSVLLAMMGGKNLLLLGVVPVEARSATVRALSWLDGIGYALLAAFFLYYRLPPPLISFAVLAALFLLAGALARRAAARR